MAIITDLPKIVAGLPSDKRQRVERIFRIDVTQSQSHVPDTMRPWVEQQFGQLEAVEHQHLVRVTNTVTWDGALFNPVRARRPMIHDQVHANPNRSPSSSVSHASELTDHFADPLHMTTEDPFGRVRGKHCVIAANVARWDTWSAVLIFDEVDPFRFDREQMRDYIATSWTWARQAHAFDPTARYFVWGWNGSLRAGASQPHAHAQMALGQGLHYARVEGLRRAALDYRARTCTNYFDDLQASHDCLGLGITTSTLRGFVYLAPMCWKETWLIGQRFDNDLADALHDVLRALIDRTGTASFNVFATLPPVEATQTQAEDWSGFPLIVRIGDRGPTTMISSDFGWIDLFAHRVIPTDPFVVKAQLGL